LTYFIQEGYGTVLVSQVADFFYRTDTSAHRIDAFKRDNFGSFFRPFLQFILEVDKVVVLPDDFLGTRVTDTLNHGRVIGRIGKVDAARQLRAERGEGGVIRHIARRKYERGWLAMKSSHFFLEVNVPGAIASNVTRAASPVTIFIQGATGRAGSETKQWE